VSVSLTDGTNSVTLDSIQSVTTSTVKNVEGKNLSGGDYKYLDQGRSGESLTLEGTQYNTAYTDMNTLESMMGNEITLSGMKDTNLNISYYIKELSFSASEGNGSDFYFFTLVLEKVRD
jgi:hypothetical protein